ncbi:MULTISPECIES: SDR family oxidoreductase [unclassified Streptomyces]|uniref:SDR family oxidoreductase n=1 Tax=unclassified Streptomyces TaxID=2593676 RepID=UPI002365A10D|nr:MULTISPECIES: SDR family oxidoreductase [unclassified Streptomyces]MDF3144733.1 SDR family oxidoreductase [Streptomyces sp. T21Q-yed]WDF36054.1 SDR family oxidoreductase [Streptomyces sp. T12]
MLRTSPLPVRGRVVAVTGGARGIGERTAGLLTRLGARVAIGDIDEERCAETAGRLGLACHGRLDVTDPESFAAFLDRVESELGPLDVLVNNAGIMPVGPLLDESDAVARRMVEINVLGVITGTKLALRRMAPRGSGHIVNVASLGGEMCVPGVASYIGTKHAVVGFTDAARLEFRTAGVRFSSVLPWFTNTELVSGTKGIRFLPNAEPEDVAAAIAATLRRPRARVRVTALHGALVQAGRFLPRSVTEGVQRVLGAESVFLGDVDDEARRAYEDRVRSL